MSNRFDNRSIDTFKRDIKFATMLEKYLFEGWLKRVKDKNSNVKVDSWKDNGCGNDGEFIEKGNTAGADYAISGSVTDWSPREVKDEPLEIKWVPTAGKFTLKENDLKAYVKENANILFIYNSVKCGTNLRKPKDYNLDQHIKLIESKNNQIKWGIMWSDQVKKFYEDAKKNNLFKPINYMGGKSGVVLKQKQFSKWFNSYDWKD
tara:strand:+ start:758 stop:1372 length:615 start_codon:yes stop_codon:yes gene_type:complete